VRTHVVCVGFVRGASMRELPSPGQRHRVSTRRRVMSETAPQGGTVVKPASSPHASAVHRTQCGAAGSRALLKLVEERCPDNLFAELMGALDRVLAAALAASDRDRRRASSRLETRPSRLHRQAACTCSLAMQTLNEPSTGRDTRPSRCGLFGSPRPYQGSALRSDPMRGSRP
jgi:hypothetical protein